MRSGVQSYYRLMYIVALILVITDSTFGTKCPHCNKDFNVLGRHIWRCHSKGTSVDFMNELSTPGANYNAADKGTSNSSSSPRVLPMATSHSQTATADDEQVEWLACHCGRRCKGRRGLRAHQWHCKTMETLLDEDPAVDRAAFAFNNDVSTLNINNDIPTYRHSNTPSTKQCSVLPGLKLPRSKALWEEANAYFHANPPLPASIENIDECVYKFQSSIYECFRSSSGFVKQKHLVMHLNVH